VTSSSTGTPPTQASIEDKLEGELLHLQDKLGITTWTSACRARARAAKDDVSASPEIRDAEAAASSPTAPRARWWPTCSPWSTSRRSLGVPIEVYTFIGSSPIRQYAENWDLDHMLKRRPRPSSSR
jgi:2-isopropylmalate synthase